MMKPSDHNARIARARDSLEGLSVGDAFGQRFFVGELIARQMIAERALPRPPWSWTDDTAMALSVYETLADAGGIDRDALARRFALRYAADRTRGYGGGAHRLLGEICAGGQWREIAPTLFEGGSYGNGGAMRVGPVGAYFFDDYELAAHHGAWSADPTHAHLEGRCGAVAIAVATAFAAATQRTAWSRDDFFAVVLRHTPPSQVRDGIESAERVPTSATPRAAAGRLGNGTQISAQDTVPFTLWCAARSPDSFEDAMWTTVEALGDRDTTCAIVGGIVAARVGTDGIPPNWRAAREPLGL